MNDARAARPVDAAELKGLPGIWLSAPLFGVAYVACAMLSRALAADVDPFVTVWLPSGLYVAVLLRHELRHWPILVLAAAIANVAFDLWNGRPTATALTFWMANGAEAIVGALLVRACVAPSPTLSTTRQVAGFLGCSALLSTFVGAEIGAATVATVLGLPVGFQTLALWLTGDMMGVLLVAPIVLTWRRPTVGEALGLPATGRSVRAVLTMVAAFVLLAVVAVFVFNNTWHPNLSIKYVLVPLVMLMAIRYGTRGASTASIIVAVVGLWFTARGAAQIEAPVPTLPGEVAWIQLYLTVVAGSGLFAAAAAAERLSAHARLRAVFDSARDAILIGDVDTGVILDVNAAATELFGRSRDDLVGSHQASLHPAEDAEAYKKRFLSRASEAKPQHRAAEVVAADGRRVPVEVSASTVTLDAGRKALVGIFRDMSDRQRADEESRAILETSMDGYWLVSGDGRLLDVNRAACAMSGYSREELLALSISDLDATEIPEETARHIRRVVEAGCDRFETRHRRKDGQVIDVEVSAQILPERADRLFVFLRDITTLRRVHQDLHYRSLLLDQINDTVTATDMEGRITYVNEAQCRMQGSTRDELIGAPVSVLGNDPERGATQDVIMSETRSAGEWVGPVVNRSKDGRERFVEVRTTVVRDDAGVALAMCGVGTDITDRRLAEAIMHARLRLLNHSVDHSLEDVLVSTLDEVEVLTGSRIGFYHFLAADQQTLALQAWSTRTRQEMCQAEGKGRHYDVAEAGVWVDCIHERRPVIHNDYPSLGHRKGLPQGHAAVDRELVVPIFRGDSIVAVLGVGNKPTPYTSTDIDTATRLADLAWDIAERKRTEQALRASEGELRAIYDNAPVMMCVLDAERHVRYVNRAFESFVGAPAGVLTTLRACGVFGCINAWDDPRGCGHGTGCAHCGVRLGLVDSLQTGASHTGIEYRTTLLLASGPRDVVMLGSTARIETATEPLLLLCLVDVTAEKQAEAELATSRDRLKALSHRLVALREEASRDLARELHDRVGQNLTALNLNFTRLQESLPSGAEDGRASGPLQDSFRLVAETMGHVRDVMAELRPPVLEDYGLAAALRWYGGQFARRTSITVSVTADDSVRQPIDVETALFRIVQEALTNAARHANAQSVLVTADRSADTFRVQVSDDGVGFDVAAVNSGCWGLLTLRERAAAIGGRVTIESATGKGTTLRVDVPI